jgi:hypothetical protein
MQGRKVTVSIDRVVRPCPHFLKKTIPIRDKEKTKFIDIFNSTF